jgi:hypothetical protein
MFLQALMIMVMTITKSCFRCVLPANISRDVEFRSVKSWCIICAPKTVGVVIWGPPLVVNSLWPISLIVCHRSSERTVHWNLQVVGPKTMALCVSVCKQPTLENRNLE